MFIYEEREEEYFDILFNNVCIFIYNKKKEGQWLNMSMVSNHVCANFCRSPNISLYVYAEK